MKKIIALLLVVLFAASLTACSIDTTHAPGATEATAQSEEINKVNIDDYDKDFKGMQKYLVDMELISDKKDATTVTNAEVIGAKSGIRYELDSSNFVEFYELYTDSTPDEAQAVYDSIKEDGTYTVLGIRKVNGVYSNSGKFLVIYPTGSSYNYDEIIDEFKKF